MFHRSAGQSWPQPSWRSLPQRPTNPLTNRLDGASAKLFPRARSCEFARGHAMTCAMRVAGMQLRPDIGQRAVSAAQVQGCAVTRAAQRGAMYRIRHARGAQTYWLTTMPGAGVAGRAPMLASTLTANCCARGSTRGVGISVLSRPHIHWIEPVAKTLAPLGCV